MRILSVDFDLVEYLKGGSFGSCESLDLFICPRLLFTELIAWKCQNFESFVGISGVNLLHLFVHHRGQTSEGCHVYNEANFIFIDIEVNFLLVDIEDSKIEQIFCGCNFRVVILKELATSIDKSVDPFFLND